MANKPYLLSIGFGMPVFGLWGHRYFPVRKKHKLRSVRVLGIHFVWTTYARKEDDD